MVPAVGVQDLVPVPPQVPEPIRKLPQARDTTVPGPISAVIPARFDTARELENRPVLPPVTFGPVMNDR